jgi:osmotically inducible protein OsmC
MAIRKSEAIWEGTLKEGGGRMKLGSGYFEGPYTFASRFEEAEGTNPEELVGAAHAGCFSMFLSSLLTKNGYVPTKIHTTATVYLGEGPTINKIELDTEAQVPGVDQETFDDLAAQAKANCPVSKALACVDEIVLDARLVS